MSIEESNNLIADFMGWVHSEDADMDAWEMSTLRYHESWDWLMPVGKKIFELLQQMLKQRKAHTCTTADLIEVDITCAIREYNFADAYEHIVRFVQWYNNQSTAEQPEGKGKEGV